MTKFRTGRDVMPPERKTKEPTPGELPSSRIPIYDAKGRRRGHVGRSASEATVARFGVTDAKLGKKDGRDAWIGGSGKVTGGYGSAQDAKLTRSLRAAKGSNK